MKKYPLLSLLLLCTLLLAGCSLFQASPMEGERLPTAVEAEAQSAPAMTQLANPWKSYDSFAEAAAACGYEGDLPEELGGYTAESFRVMNGELLELRYGLDGAVLTLRHSPERDADISGVYADFGEAALADYAAGSSAHYRAADGTELLLLFHGTEGSYSLYAGAGFAEGTAEAMTALIFGA